MSIFGRSFDEEGKGDMNIGQAADQSGIPAKTTR
jgi:hypothetical protein